ncbi:MAG: hypothetical protein SFY96_07285 [Planctomycetota bacterium]|nr:hypothetical protein [Planctomycetota bacterium]
MELATQVTITHCHFATKAGRRLKPTFHTARERAMRCTSLVAFTCLTVAGGCAAHNDLYERMTRAARPDDGVQQTQFAHIGHIDTLHGRFEVCVQSIVIKGMLAPRGLRNLLLFSSNGDLAKTYSAVNCTPLWCEGGRIYLSGFGWVPGIPIDPAIAGRFASDEMQSGNVIDFSQGLEHAIVTREKRYGSSGGIEDDIWR